MLYSSWFLKKAKAFFEAHVFYGLSMVSTPSKSYSIVILPNVPSWKDVWAWSNSHRIVCICTQGVTVLKKVLILKICPFFGKTFLFWFFIGFWLRFFSDQTISCLVFLTAWWLFYSIFMRLFPSWCPYIPYENLCINDIILLSFNIDRTWKM